MPTRFSIVVVGDGAVGKSAMTLRFLRDQFHDEYDPTIEDSYCKHIEVDGNEYTLDVIDTAGQHEYRGHWNDQPLRAGDGFICVYSIASMGSFQEMAGFRDQIWRAKESEHVPIVVAANKCDLEERQVATEVGREFAELSNAFYIETSAKTGHNIHEMVHELVREIVRTRALLGEGTDEKVEGGHPTKDDDDHPQDDNRSDTVMSPGTEYMKSPTSTAPMKMDTHDGDDEEERCCCTIM